MKLDLKAAWWTTKAFLLVIGAACVVAFFRSLHTFYAVLFSMAALASWYPVYFVLAKVRARRRSSGEDARFQRPVAGFDSQTPLHPKKRWILRTLRFALDAADDRLHAAEVKLRNDLEQLGPVGRVVDALPADVRPQFRSSPGAAGVLRPGELRAAAATKSLPTVVRSAAKREPGADPTRSVPARDRFAEWEARRAGVLPAIKPHRGRRVTAANFDARFQES